jgi:hypothetical protein
VNNAVREGLEFSLKKQTLTGKRFGPTADFTRHLRTHMGPKQDKSHLPVHEGDKPFACGMSFIFELFNLTLYFSEL